MESPNATTVPSVVFEYTSRPSTKYHEPVVPVYAVGAESLTWFPEAM